MRTVLAYPGTMAHAQQAALALHEANRLQAFVTTLGWRPEGRVAAVIDHLPAVIGEPISRQLRRRSIATVPDRLVHTHPLWELMRLGMSVSTRHVVLTDLVWDFMSHRFDRMIANNYVEQGEAIHGFEYTALAAFKRAKECGIARVLHLPSLDSRCFEQIQSREKSQWPELIGPHDDYFAAKFERRYARRCEEIALADVVIANSSLTARSHIEAGADPAKVFAVPLGAPPAIERSGIRPRPVTAPLKVVWAGPFSLRKGAHYLLEAWQHLASGGAARLDIYGQQVLPKRLDAANAPGIDFHGSVPQSSLFTAFEDADVLVFPTLSDGFGMVVAEAMAHGLPVITTDQAGAADLITPDNGLIVPAANARAIADALRWCLDNRQRLSEMRFHARETAARQQWSDFRRDLIVALDAGLRKDTVRPKLDPILR